MQSVVTLLVGPVLGAVYRVAMGNRKNTALLAMISTLFSLALKWSKVVDPGACREALPPGGDNFCSSQFWPLGAPKAALCDYIAPLTNQADLACPRGAGFWPPPHIPQGVCFCSLPEGGLLCIKHQRVRLNRRVADLELSIWESASPSNTTASQVISDHGYSPSLCLRVSLGPAKLLTLGVGCARLTRVCRSGVADTAANSRP